MKDKISVLSNQSNSPIASIKKREGRFNEVIKTANRKLSENLSIQQDFTFLEKKKLEMRGLYFL